MSRPLIVIRPEPGCSATVVSARERGLDARGYPLFRIALRPWCAPEEPIDALLLGSANAVRHGGAVLASLRAKPVYAVGEATAAAARDAGFIVAATGTGRLQAVLDGLTGPLRLLRLAGEDHVALVPPPGVTIETRIAYAAQALPIPGELASILQHGAVVALHSASAAAHFANECERLGLDRRSIALAALAPRIAEAAGGGWQARRAAPTPSEAGLLALAADLCHTPLGREGR